MPPPRSSLPPPRLIRAQLLRAAGLDFTPAGPRVDEEAIRAALTAEGASPRDMADALAEMKARKLAERNPQACVIGCDQVLDMRRSGLRQTRRSATRPGRSSARLRGQTTCSALGHRPLPRRHNPSGDMSARPA